jgi:endonuclease/exonuclease/phosphatase family metal-dependent hydrolase
MNTLRVATYNITSGYDAQGTFQLELIARTIEASQADVVVLQEADTGRPAGFEIDQVEFLARRLRMFQAYQSGDDKLHGVAILSRWPITNLNRIVLADPRRSSGAVRAQVQDVQTGRQVVVVGAQVTGTDEETRLRQLVTLFSMFGDASPLVVALDTEKPPEDVVYQQMIAAGFVDPDVSLGIERGFTFPAIGPTVRRDYLLVRGLVPLASRQVDRSGSNHRLVVIEAGWP